MDKRAEKQMIKSAELSKLAEDEARDALEKLGKAEDNGDALLAVMTSLAYSNLAIVHKLDAIYNKQPQ